MKIEKINELVKRYEVGDEVCEIGTEALRQLHEIVEAAKDVVNGLHDINFLTYMAHLHKCIETFEAKK